MIIACLGGNLLCVKVLLAAGVDIRAVHPDTKTLAPSRASLEEAQHYEAAAVMIRVLAAAGADACIVDHNNVSPLNLACVNEDVESVEALIQAGADVNNVAKNSITPLHTACTQGYVATTIALLAAGADTTCSTEDSFTPLHFAVFPPNIELVRFLRSNKIVGVAASVAD